MTAHYVSLVGSFLVLWGLLLNTWFRGDDFEFLANRVGDSPVKDVWAAHVEHWSTGPILIWRALYAAFGMSSAAPYLAASLFMHVLAGHLLWRLMRRAGLTPWLATGLTASFLVMGAGWENITWAFQVGFLGSFAMGLASVALCLRGTRRAFVLALALSLLSLAFSGISIAFAIASALTLLLGGRVRRAVVLILATGGVYTSWYLLNLDNIRPPAHVRGRAERLANAGGWAWELLGSSYERYTTVTGTGAVTAVALVLFLAWRVGEPIDVWRLDADDPRRLRLTTLVSMTAAALLLVAMFAINRNDISDPDTSRYLYFVIALSLPLIGAALAHLAATPWAARLVAVFVAYVIVQQGLLLLAEERRLESPQLRADTLGLARLIDEGAPVVSVALGVDVNTESITKWVREGALGRLEDVPDQFVLDARAIGLVSGFEQRPPDSGTGVVRPGDAHAEPLRAGACQTVGASSGAIAATLSLSPGQTVSMTAEHTGLLRYRVVDRGERSRQMKLEVPVNDARWITTRVPLELEVVTGSGLDVTFCTP